MNNDSYEDQRFIESLLNNKNVELQKKRQHFVPAFYLRNFANDEGVVWVYDRKEKRVFHNIPENVCVKNHLYETRWENASKLLGKYVFYNDIENLFSAKEEIWAPFIKSLLKRIRLNIADNSRALICSREEKEILIDFFLCTFFRNPSSLNDVVDYYENIDIKGDKEIVENLNALKRQFDSWGFGSPKSLLRHTTKITTFDAEMKGSPLNVYTNLFKNLHLCFIRTKNQSFITSCFPTIFMEDDNDKQQYNILPISPSVALLFTDDPSWRDRRNKLTIVTDEMISRINFRYTDYDKDITQFLIAKNKKDLDDFKNL